MLGVKRMPRPLSESRKPESRRKTAVLRGMRLRPIDSPPSFPGQPCRSRGEGWGEEQFVLSWVLEAGVEQMLRALEGGLGREHQAEPEDKLACLTALERKVLWLSTWM